METAASGKWIELYQLAMGIYMTYPWKRLEPEQLIWLSIPSGERELFISFTQHNDKNAIDFHIGPDGLGTYRRMLTAAPSEKSEIERALHCYSIRFGEQPDINEEDVRIIDSVSVAFPHTMRVVTFRMYEPGYLTVNPELEDVPVLTEICEQLIDALDAFEQDGIAVNFEKGELFHRHYDTAAARWVNEAAPPEIEPEEPKKLETGDELLRARVLRRPVVDARLELDCFYIPQAVNEPEYKKPFYPRVMVLADTVSGNIAAFETLTPEDTVQDKLYTIITAFIAKYGRPLVIYMQDRMLCDICADFFEFLQIPYRRVSFLNVINNFKLSKGITKLETTEE